MKTKSPADEAQAFIKKYIAPARPRPAIDAEARRARADAERKDAQLARKALVAGGLDVKRLDKLARERGQARRSLADKHRRLAVKGSAAVDRDLADLTPVLTADPDT